MGGEGCRGRPSRTKRLGSFGSRRAARPTRYAMFFMNAKALEQLDVAKGFESALARPLVVIDEGADRWGVGGRSAVQDAIADVALGAADPHGRGRGLGGDGRGDRRSPARRLSVRLRRSKMSSRRSQPPFRTPISRSSGI